MPPSGFPWPGLPYPALITAAGTATLTVMLLVASHYFDHSGGLLTISIILILAFIAVTLASLIYEVPQNPLTEILIGSLSTSVGAIIAFWMSKRK